MQALHPAIATALRPFAPKGDDMVSAKQTRFQSPYEWEFKGRDLDVVMSAANAKATQIDDQRGPAVKFSRMEGETFVVTLRYYNL